MLKNANQRPKTGVMQQALRRKPRNVTFTQAAKGSILAKSGDPKDPAIIMAKIIHALIFRYSPGV